ncbi:hypothetical protein [Halodesulfovibrio sp. MK-HDV]|uniref:hypothetical protein n=1 Tax=Halodesulfovibrio sp. MK-HDV TaxID=2599925 RepID=UPI00136E9750|nr:hypothetical protein [Halodesulfovibrio sp. MK-HDV]KAF1076258.1 hypothetical protein MKHDV_01279 [Halodesulfovibrio sp. MK-HDV]
MVATILNQTGQLELSGLAEQFRGNLHNSPYYLEVDTVAGIPVIAHCDCCGHLICEGEVHTSNNHGVWCTRCMPRGC